MQKNVAPPRDGVSISTFYLDHASEAAQHPKNWTPCEWARYQIPIYMAGCKLTVQDLADAIGIPAEKLQKKLDGDRDFTLKEIEDIAVRLDHTAWHLMGGKERDWPRRWDEVVRDTAQRVRERVLQEGARAKRTGLGDDGKTLHYRVTFPADRARIAALYGGATVALVGVSAAVGRWTR